ncbi:MATE family efflux transporter [Tellurirhabdus bombi]|uniref:MATE family efflux transporter n=1 Tax=Tellurirhabdus bombi TaxID=2907205 RepID=UPI001F43CD20|nr:MATE family efflux transporter [Tellurirhabdus bombi]
MSLSKNIVVSFLYKGINIATQFLLVRITLSYISTTEYGVWLTLSSFLTWFAIFDFGFTNGLRNKVTLAYADGKLEKAQPYISTSYAFLFLVISVMLLLFGISTVFVNWQQLFNAPNELAATLPLILIIAFALFCLRLLLNLISAILLAVHQAGQVELINTAIQVATLVGLMLWANTSDVALFEVAVVYSLMPVVVLFLASLIFFGNAYKAIRPTISSIQWSLFGELGVVGGKFFGLQLVSLVLFSSQNFIISHLFNPAEVTPFNLVYRYFSVIPIVFNVLLVPHWSAITEAYYKHNFEWLQQTLKRLLFFWSLFALLSLSMFLIAPWVYDLWLGPGHVPIPSVLTIVLSISTIVTAWGNLFSLLLNAMGAITISLITAFVIVFISVPLASYLSTFPQLGVSGVPLGFTICLLPGAILQPYQCYKLLARRAAGIWTK